MDNGNSGLTASFGAFPWLSRTPLRYKVHPAGGGALIFPLKSGTASPSPLFASGQGPAETLFLLYTQYHNQLIVHIADDKGDNRVMGDCSQQAGGTTSWDYCHVSCPRERERESE